MTSQPAVSVELEEFLREQIGLHATDKVNPADRLEDDLHVTGDDAAELIEAFVTRFNIKNGDFVFQSYSSEEGYDLFFFLRFLVRKRPLKIDKEPLTVAMLQRAIAWAYGTANALKSEMRGPPLPHRGPSDKARHTWIWRVGEPLSGDPTRGTGGSNQ
jgi:hypothetical protein